MRTLLLVSLLCTAIMAGTNNLVTVSSGKVQTSHVNQFTTALKENFVPRNSSGVPTSSAGSCGESSLRWSTLFGVNLDISGALTIPNLSVARTKLGVLTSQVSSSTGAAADATTTIADVPNLSVTITTNGSPVSVFVVGDGTANDGYLWSSDGNADGVVSCRWVIVRGATTIAQLRTGVIDGAGTSQDDDLAGIRAHDVVAAGTYTYKVRYQTLSNTNDICRIRYGVLVAHEL